MNLINDFLLWLGSLSCVDAVLYWVALLLVDFILIDRVWSRGRVSSKRLVLNFWIPFGVFIPIFWLLRLPSPIVADLVVAGILVLFFGLIRPILYRRQYGK